MPMIQRKAPLPIQGRRRQHRWRALLWSALTLTTPSWRRWGSRPDSQMVCCEVVDVVVPEGLRTLRLEMRRRRSLSGACQSSPPFLGYRRASARDAKVNDQPFKMAKNDPYKSASRPSGRFQVMTKKLYIGVPRKEEKSMAMRGLGLRGLICRSCCPLRRLIFLTA
jgi:hypothetical protein